LVVYGFGPGELAPPEYLVEGERLRTLPDLVARGLRVLFVGFNPSIRAARVGHYYAGRSNRFWAMLAGAGLTPRLLRPEEDRSLLGMGIGITDLVKRPTRSAAEIGRAEYREGVARLMTLVEALRPQVICYNGKGVYLTASGAAAAPWGAQPDPLLPGVVDFVAPSPSGLARIPFEDKVRRYAELRALLEDMAR
jgi:double-stranded uracil-DNA glycosylase